MDSLHIIPVFVHYTGSTHGRDCFSVVSILKLNDAFGLRVTQLIVAIVFALYHVALGWNIVTAFLGPGIWAFVFGIAAIRSNGIALPTGIHVG